MLVLTLFSFCLQINFATLFRGTRRIKMEAPVQSLLTIIVDRSNSSLLTILSHLSVLFLLGSFPLLSLDCEFYPYSFPSLIGSAFLLSLECGFYPHSFPSLIGSAFLLSLECGFYPHSFPYVDGHAPEIDEEDVKDEDEDREHQREVYSGNRNERRPSRR
jgi:hypothetical protein